LKYFAKKRIGKIGYVVDLSDFLLSSLQYRMSRNLLQTFRDITHIKIFHYSWNKKKQKLG